jgi:hypothetical protein
VAQGNGARGKADCLQRRKLEKSLRAKKLNFKLYA